MVSPALQQNAVASSFSGKQGGGLQRPAVTVLKSSITPGDNGAGLLLPHATSPPGKQQKGGNSSSKSPVHRPAASTSSGSRAKSASPKLRGAASQANNQP